jgi:hypothetical protein
LVPVVFLSAIAMTVFGQAELELIDGRVLAGMDVRREGDVYVLTLEGGDTIALPVELVATVRLLGTGTPRNLAGHEAKVPTPSEQLEVLGEPARFQKSIVDSTWVPESDWDMDPEKQNNFRPSTWSKSPIDPNWEPESDWSADDDVLESSRSAWQKSGIDSQWTPTDGFADSVGRGR